MEGPRLLDRLPAQRPESTFKDHHPTYSPAEAALEANRCLYCFDAPCATACPTHIDVPSFIRRISDGESVTSLFAEQNNNF